MSIIKVPKKYKKPIQKKTTAIRKKTTEAEKYLRLLLVVSLAIIFFGIFIFCLSLIFPTAEFPTYFTLTIFGALGGLIDSFLLDSKLELPKWSEDGKEFYPGSMGEMVVGVAAAFVAYNLLSAIQIEGVNSEDPFGIAVTAIIGGYGGKAILNNVLSRHIKKIDVLEKQKEKAIKEKVDFEVKVRDLETGDTLIDKVNEQIHSGLSEEEVAKLEREIIDAPNSAKERIFKIAKEVRSMGWRAKGLKTRVERTIPIFRALANSNPKDHRFQAQLGYAYKDSDPPNLVEAITHLDQAIRIRGNKIEGNTWKYELNRAIAKILRKQEVNGTFLTNAEFGQEILDDLLTVDRVYSITKVLQESNNTDVDIPLQKWFEANKNWIEKRSDGKALAEKILPVPLSGNLDNIDRSPSQPSQTPLLSNIDQQATIASPTFQPVTIIKAPTLELKGSVGRGGKNNSEDVIKVKERLQELGFDFFKPGGNIDQGLIQAIKLFQSIITGKTSLGGDGVIDVNKNTHKFLQAANAPRWMLMPTKGEGFFNREREIETWDHHDYGTSWLADTIKAAGEHYEKTYRQGNSRISLIPINDVSFKQGGDTPDHAGHECGNACDVALPRKDGNYRQVLPSWQDSKYARDAARAIIKSLRAQPLVTRVLFNDTVLINEGLCKLARGHNNHIHFEVGVPQPEKAIASAPLHSENLLPTTTTPIRSVTQQPDRWDLALQNAQTTGASLKTARPEGISQGGVSASHQIAKVDLPRVEAIKENLYKVGVKCDVPPAIIAAIASRESHCGNILQNGWGDRGNAFGIMQVDKRYHKIAGVNEGPGSVAHLEQAVGIFKNYRQQISRNHPKWSDANLLKGAAVAYNSGVGNVRSIGGMDQGTTHDDYGSDVIARAQFYSKHLKSLAECKSPQQNGHSPQIIVPTQSLLPIGVIQDTLEEVEEPMDISRWDRELVSAVQAGLHQLGLLTTVGDPQELKRVWAKFKKRHHQGEPTLIGPGSAQLLLDLLEVPHPVIPEQVLNGQKIEVDVKAGSKTGIAKRLPGYNTLVYEHEYIRPGVPLTWGECTKGMSRWPTQKVEVDNAKRLAQVFGEVRQKYGTPIIITSGFRPPAVNREQRGAKYSQHILFKALDLVPKDRNLPKLLQVLRNTPSVIRIGRGEKRGFLHMDIRDNNAPPGFRLRDVGPGREFPY